MFNIGIGSRDTSARLDVSPRPTPPLSIDNRVDTVQEGGSLAQMTEI